jgi:hypothetical protein
MTDTSSNATLYKKMAAVMGALKRVPKEGTNAHFGYKYARAEDVADEIRAQLAAQNIAFFAEIVSKQLDGSMWIVDFVFTFACGDTGATISKAWSSEAVAANSKGRDDKGLNKAATAAEKYFLLKTFIVSTGDEPDADADGEPAARTQTPRIASPAPVSRHDKLAAWLERTTRDYSLAQKDVLDALGVDNIDDWLGTEDNANKAIDTYIARQLEASR